MPTAHPMDNSVPPRNGAPLPSNDDYLFQVRKIESLSLLAGGVAHDFNNLLTTILGNVDLARSIIGQGSPDLQSYVEEIQNASLRAAELCRQLLAFSGRGQLRLGIVELKPLIEEMEEILALSASDETHLVWELPSGLPRVHGNPEEIQRLLAQLVHNGAEATAEEGGTIRVSLGTAAASDPLLVKALGSPLDDGRDYVFIEVVDDGVGMDRATRLKIFDPFFTTKGAGRGLGLTGVFGTVRAHRGRMHVESEQGAGTLLRVYLPAAADAEGV